MLFKNDGEATYLDAWHEAIKAEGTVTDALLGMEVPMKACPCQTFTTITHCAPLVISMEMKL